MAKVQLTITATIDVLPKDFDTDNLEDAMVKIKGYLEDLIMDPGETLQDASDLKYQLKSLE